MPHGRGDTKDMLAVLGRVRQLLERIEACCLSKSLASASFLEQPLALLWTVYGQVSHVFGPGQRRRLFFCNLGQSVQSNFLFALRNCQPLEPFGLQFHRKRSQSELRAVPTDQHCFHWSWVPWAHIHVRSAKLFSTLGPTSL